MATIINGMVRKYSNRNAIKVKNESENNKRFMRHLVEYVSIDFNNIYEIAKQDKRIDVMEAELDRLTREEFLHLAVLSCTTKHPSARRILMDLVTLHLGKIKNKDFNIILNLLKKCEDKSLVFNVHDTLSQHLEGYNKLYTKYCQDKYGYNRK